MEQHKLHNLIEKMRVFSSDIHNIAKGRPGQAHAHLPCVSSNFIEVYNNKMTS